VVNQSGVNTGGDVETKTVVNVQHLADDHGFDPDWVAELDPQTMIAVHSKEHAVRANLTHEH
jgi:hypothetical protein